MSGKINGKEIILGGQHLILSSGRAVYWTSQKLLVVSDLHLGKSSYFRNSGIPIPSTVMNKDLDKLSLLIKYFAPESLIITGDMFHHTYNADVAVFKQWRTHTGIPMSLVPGNHDRLTNLNYQDLGITVTSPQHIIGPFLFEHETKAASEDHIHISGHLHPGYLLQGKAKQAVRLPCFIVTERQLILPAFSAFTGLYTNHDFNEKSNYFVIAGEEVLCISGAN